MSNAPDIVTHGLEQARYALTKLIGMTNAHLRPLTLKRGLKQRASGPLKQLEIIVRRLLVLMALALRLAPVRPRATSLPLLEGTELVTFPAPRRFALSGRVQPAVAPEASVLFPGSVRASGPVPAAPFLARVSALYRVLENPEVHAKRLARSLARQQKRGDLKPVALPMASAYRLRPELGAIATALPGLLSAALEKWDNSS
ncbi:hypothetical protein [Hyphomonas sp.]|uniref:hypothetical protein n=1 Tax=Hyphomonas sp. TaxID=87 RepID=UPI0035647C1E